MIIKQATIATTTARSINPPIAKPTPRFGAPLPLSLLSEFPSLGMLSVGDVVAVVAESVVVELVAVVVVELYVVEASVPDVVSPDVVGVGSGGRVNFQ